MDDSNVLSGRVPRGRAPGGSPDPAVPQYLSDTYAWAYLHPWSLRIFDHAPVVSAILWGNYHRLERAALEAVRPAETVLQAACVYGPFSRRLADRIGPRGRLDIVDVAPIQVENCSRKLADLRHARARVADAGTPASERYDTVICFFLLHELPQEHKRRVVDSLLSQLAPGGRAVFVDYHAPARAHPLRWVTRLVFRWLEPFAASMWRHEIHELATDPRRFRWRKCLFFGGLFQRVVVEARGAADSPG